MADLEGDDSATDDLSALRSEFREVIGRHPSPKWGADKLREKIEEARENPTPPPPDAPLPVSTPAEPVRVILLCNHIFLPEDPTAPGWETCGTTKRYEGETDGRRTKLDMHPTLAEFLQKRRQAEILD